MGIALMYHPSHAIFSWVRLMTSVGFNPFLDLAVPVINDLDALLKLPILVDNFVLNEADLFGEVLDSIDPIVEYDDGI